MILEKALKILEQPMCDQCLGRQFGQLLHGYTNEQRGHLIRTIAAMAIDQEKANPTVDYANFTEFTFHNRDEKKAQKKPCSACNGLFEKLETWIAKAYKKAGKLEFKTFLIGTKPPFALVATEEQLWERVGIDYCEPLNAQINREVGKQLEKQFHAKFDPKRPDVAFLLNMDSNTVDIHVNPLFIAGEYQKLKRGIPQTRWPSGKYRTSVEQIIAKPYMKTTKGTGHKLHAMGREDIDARCLGWRPFILEILEPVTRTIDLKKLAKKIGKEVRVQHLRYATINDVRTLKEAHPDKTYRIFVMTKESFDKKDIKKLATLKEIRQQTPTRVQHRRADKRRIRHVRQIKARVVNKKTLELIVRAEAGLYIKELITGDNGRTVPCVSDILGKSCTFRDLDVLAIHF
ncbi:tRNA pseudouridine(54/55) synthase Pus10 [Candidatus Woesearchaeota archaeon]|nr:tRNA pseudouridine(54/55) synthase Pus10 [Candidatus Woesearchaeota archaeon]